MLNLIAGLIAFFLCPLLALWGLNTISEQAHLGWYIPHGLWTYVGCWAVAAGFGRKTCLGNDAPANVGCYCWVSAFLVTPKVTAQEEK
jgi:hypothetical protein